jgi:hypothetical protein
MKKPLEEIAISPEPKIELNIESLLRINGILELLIRLSKELAFEEVFNKATQWWDETAKLQQTLFMFYHVFLALYYRKRRM